MNTTTLILVVIGLLIINNIIYKKFIDTKGSKGEQGPEGPEGPAGPAGPAGGPPGPEGAIGPAGPVGPKGPQGPIGLKGVKGDKGGIGPKGEKGDKGERGQIGKTGPRGESGPKGGTGATGPKGDKGDKGNPSTVAGPKGDVCHGTSADCISNAKFNKLKNLAIGALNNTTPTIATGKISLKDGLVFNHRTDYNGQANVMSANSSITSRHNPPGHPHTGIMDFGMWAPNDTKTPVCPLGPNESIVRCQNKGVPFQGYIPLSLTKDSVTIRGKTTHGGDICLTSKDRRYTKCMNFDQFDKLVKLAHNIDKKDDKLSFSNKVTTAWGEDNSSEKGQADPVKTAGDTRRAANAAAASTRATCLANPRCKCETIDNFCWHQGECVMKPSTGCP